MNLKLTQHRKTYSFWVLLHHPLENKITSKSTSKNNTNNTKGKLGNQKSSFFCNFTRFLPILRSSIATWRMARFISVQTSDWSWGLMLVSSFWRTTWAAEPGVTSQAPICHGILPQVQHMLTKSCRYLQSPDTYVDLYGWWFQAGWKQHDEYELEKKTWHQEPGNPWEPSVPGTEYDGLTAQRTLSRNCWLNHNFWKLDASPCELNLWGSCWGRKLTGHRTSQT